MRKFIKNNWKKAVGFMTLALGVMVLGASSTYAQAVADPALTDAIASSTNFFTANAAVIVSFVVDMILKLAGIALAIGAVYFVYRKIRGIFRS